MRKILYQLFLLFFLVLLLENANAQQTVSKRAAANSEIRLKKVDTYVQEKMKENHIPGLSLAVVREGKLILAKGYGLSNLELSTPATEKTAFAIFSITKTFTAVATMMLVEDGKIALEDAITKHLSGVPSKWNAVTIRHLLTHTSGLPDICDASPDPCQTSTDYSQEQVVRMVANLPEKFSAGEKWEYNNTGYFMLGMLIEKVTGKTYENFLKQRVFEPLNMQDSRLENYKEVIFNRADGYTWKDGKYQNALRVSPTLAFSLGGIVSTVLDLAKYDAALYTDRLLKKATLEKMWTIAKLNDGRPTEHGLGFGMTPFRGHRRVGHSGGHNGFSTTITRLIDDKITVIILSNADSKGYKTKNGFLISDIANHIASFYFEN